MATGLTGAIGVRSGFARIVQMPSLFARKKLQFFKIKTHFGLEAKGLIGTRADMTRSRCPLLRKEQKAFVRFELLPR